MIDNLYEAMLKFFGPDEFDNYSQEENKKHRDFMNSISGKEVELVFTHGDAFEKDNNYWLPDCMWSEVLPEMEKDLENK